jgi:nucleosome assembly protein 1-like 1
LGEDIKEKLIPRAIDWFTGEALQFEEVDDEMEEGDFEDEVSILSISAITKKG